MKKLSLFQKLEGIVCGLSIITCYIGAYKNNLPFIVSNVLIFILSLNALLYSCVSDEIAELKDKVGKEED